MTHFTIQNRQNSPKIIHASTAAPRLVGATGQSLALALCALIAVLFAAVPRANAGTARTPERAALPQVLQLPLLMPSKATKPLEYAALSIRGVCHEGIVVFRVKNGSKEWLARGHMKVIDAQTKQVVRQRWLRFGERQSASFRFGPDQVPSGRYRIIVTMPDRTMSYVKSFRGRCPQPSDDVREARR